MADKKDKGTPDEMPPNTHPNYADPPVVEVIFQFMFAGSQEKPAWSEDAAKAFLSKVVPESSRMEILPVFRPEYRDERLLVQAVVERVRSRNKQGDLAVQIGNNLLACHLLRRRGEPFDVSNLLRYSAEVLPTYREVFKPSSLRRLALGYVDIIDLPGDTADLDEYFNVGAKLPEGDRKFLLRAYHFRGSVVLSAERDKVLDIEVQTVSAPRKGVCRVRLDWFLSEEAPVQPDLEIWLRSAESVMNDWFHRCLTPKCLELFGPKG